MNVTLDHAELNAELAEAYELGFTEGAGMAEEEIARLRRKVRKFKRGIRRLTTACVPEPLIVSTREVDVVFRSRHLSSDLTLVGVEDAETGRSVSIGTWTVSPTDDAEHRLRLKVLE